MGKETILYYVLEETITDRVNNLKNHFWQKVRLNSFVVEEGEITVVTFMIPTNAVPTSALQTAVLPTVADSTLKDRWKRKKLLRVINESIEKYAEMAEYSDSAWIVMQPGLYEIYARSKDLGHTEPFTWTESPEAVFWNLSDKLFDENLINKKPDSCMLLLGSSLFPEEQLRHFTEKMQPYFRYINQFIVIYEPDEDEENVNRFEETIDSCMEMLYYEYGLVGRVWHGSCSKEKCYEVKKRVYNRLYLDYGYMGQLPYHMMRQGGIYIDVFSSEEKEQRIRKKCSGISYMSPRKYLDTMVKSGYDKLVNQAQI